MEKTLLFTATFICLLFHPVHAQSVLQSFDKDTFFIEGCPLVSPGNNLIALQARDRANLYTNNAFLWIGSMEKGNFTKVYNDPVGRICWINNNEVAFMDSQAVVYQFWLKNPAPPYLIVRVININTKNTRELFRQEIKTIPGSGGQFEIINLIQISNTGRYLLMNDQNGFFLQDIMTGSRLPVENFNFSFSGRSRFRFDNSDTKALCFDDSNRTYTLYSINEKEAVPVKQYNTAALGGKEPTSYFRFDDSGNRIIFAFEKCSGNCYYEIYSLDLSSGMVSKVCQVSGGKVLSLDWNRDLTEILYNDNHTRLIKQQCGNIK
ncbi:MAG: hypothetical protein JXB88_21670 [Spirochaetales bacterium]|nr:hypothetical protein [Spirochaetales bacterium]